MGEKRRSTSKSLAKNKKRKGPHLPNSILKTIANEKRPLNSDEEDDEIDSDDVNVDLYEYEEGVPEEESKKNNRYDRVDNYEYELPEDFEVSFFLFANTPPLHELQVFNFSDKR